MQARALESRFSAMACAKCFREQAGSHRAWCAHHGLLQSWVGGAMVIVLSSDRERAEHTLDRVRASLPSGLPYRDPTFDIIGSQLRGRAFRCASKFVLVSSVIGDQQRPIFHGSS
jgi:hypothetical protein